MVSTTANLIARVRALGTSVFRLAAALILAFVGAGLLVFAGHWAWTYPERVEAAKAESVRSWTADMSSTLSMTARAKTKLLDGSIHVIVDFVGHPEYLSSPANQSRGFHIRWTDADGFVRVEKFLELSEFSTRVTESGKKSGLNAQFTQAMSLRDYGKLETMRIGWTVETETPRPAVPRAPQTPQDEVASDDHCAPKLTRQERLRRLARHGNVRETGYNTFSAGLRTVTLSGSEVIYCQ